MRKLLLIVLLVPFCTTFTVGCGGSGENKVIEQAPEATPEMIAQEEEDMETTE